MRHIFFWISSLLLFPACDNNKRLAEYEAKIRATEIDIPLDSMKMLIPEKDSPIPGCNDSARLRYVVYFDSTQCSPCQLGKMGIWRSIIKHTEKIGMDVDFQFIFCSKANQREKLEETFFSRKTFLRIFVDTAGIIGRNNPLLAQSPLFHTFVLNDKNFIEVIGDASNSEMVERKYYEFLRKKKAERDIP